MVDKVAWVEGVAKFFAFFEIIAAAREIDGSPGKSRDVRRRVKTR